MRIYLPLSDALREHLAQGQDPAASLTLAAHTPLWTVTPAAQADEAEADLEDLEYDALQDAVHVALGGVPPQARALVIAADLPPRAEVRAATQEHGAFGVLLSQEATARIASYHVTELGARAAAEDDTDPALLWFDRSERAEALAYLDGEAPTVPASGA